MTASQSAVQGLEDIYDAIASAVDEAPEAGRELFLAKLALLLANEIGDAPCVLELIRLAAKA
ncbi:hypothetical protein PTE30175_02379 [Pandoraea terrae]|uniref:DUF2783 domain-containing protein n=1 Tax=Pandoraea terrae TaxID=1537710 RepID=A0A5E4V626_9BURK|nr:DUF2783 domain-containing protein [Pandoraea terrae]VVE07303.1 hypothetical protein PTE30175_02379 [Pandoraea terrae]